MESTGRRQSSRLAAGYDQARRGIHSARHLSRGSQGCGPGPTHPACWLPGMHVSFLGIQRKRAGFCVGLGSGHRLALNTVQPDLAATPRTQRGTVRAPDSYATIVASRAASRPKASTGILRHVLPPPITCRGLARQKGTAARTRAHGSRRRGPENVRCCSCWGIGPPERMGRAAHGRPPPRLPHCEHTSYVLPAYPLCHHLCTHRLSGVICRHLPL